MDDDKIINYKHICAESDLPKEGLAVTTKADFFSPKSTNQMKQTRHLSS